MNERETRLNEVDVLEKHMDGYSIGERGVDSPSRRYLNSRRMEIERLTRGTTDPIEDSLRLSELDALETYLNKSGIGKDNPDQPMRAYLKQRREELTTAQVPKVEQPVAASPERPREPVVRNKQRRWQPPAGQQVNAPAPDAK